MSATAGPDAPIGGRQRPEKTGRFLLYALLQQVYAAVKVLEAGVGAEAISALLVATPGDNTDSTLNGQPAVVS